MSSPVAIAARRVTHEFHGVVVSAGLMQRTVKVRVAGQKYDKFVKKYYPDPKTYLVHDPNSSLRTGDVVAIAPGWRTSRHKRHFVKHIIAPCGEPIESRPPVLSLEELITEREAKKKVKDDRKILRKESEKSSEVAKNSAASKRGANHSQNSPPKPSPTGKVV